MAVLFRFIVTLIPAWIVAYVLASICHSQMVLTGLTSVGVSIPVKDWLAMTVYDLWGLLPAYGSAMLVALLLAMLVVRFLLRPQLPSRALALYMLAGALAVMTMLLAMQPLLNVTLIAGARSTAGFILQALAGAAGGAVFCRLRLLNSSPSAS
ncbi:hypothetical protein [Alteromonas sp. CYL-A6]|uniref:hypothetical protein n=1 Tax=Alteromonas nitratireducens TaxID=3390813 RepID=UPI0034C11093